MHAMQSQEHRQVAVAGSGDPVRRPSPPVRWWEQGNDAEAARRDATRRARELEVPLERVAVLGED